MFRVVFHPSSGAHNTVSTESGINETVTAKCRERDWAGTAVKKYKKYSKQAHIRH